MGWRGPGPGLVTVAASLILSVLLARSEAVVRAVLRGNSSSVDFADLPALFGVPLSPEGVRGYLVEARPANACQPIEGPRLGNGSLGAIALIRRYDCAFDLKVLHAQRAGFEAAIVHNAASQDLRVIVRCDKSAHVLLLPDAPPCPDLDCHPVLAAAWVLGRALALLASTLMVLRRLWLWARAWSSRTAATKTQPGQKAQVRTFTRHSDLCAICLDEYEEGDRLKILPCSHTYHCRCIDPWFSLAAQRACPMCKQSVASTRGSSDSVTESCGDEDPSLPGHPPPIWAIQARLRSRRLELLARAGPRPNCSTTSLGAAENVLSSSSDGSPGPS
uniref:E3 ubiquitin-protein ligase ZNRF4 n=1 Tax=Castor canadensis TaxID=51338 RepID=A0A8C0WFJ8_CASCN